MITIVATGVTGGCGLPAIEQLISSDQGPYRIIIGSRRVLDSPEVKAAAEELLARRKSSKTTIEYLPLNLTSLDSVRQFAAGVKESIGGNENHGMIDVLLLCAGAVCSNRRDFNVSRTGKDEVEETLVVNVLSQVLLSHLLLEDLAPEGRVVIVNSSMHFYGPENATPEMIDTVLGPRKWSAMQAYKFSKLIMMYFAQILKRDERFNIDSRRVLSLHPGFIPDTGLVRETPRPVAWLMANILPYLPGTSSVAAGGRTIIQAMFDRDLPSGTYLNQTKLGPYAAQCDKSELREQWRNWLIQKGVWFEDEEDE